MGKQTDFTNRMDAIFEPWEYHLFEKLKEADEISARITTEATLFSIPAEFRQEYMSKKLLDMIDQIAENREKKFRGPKKPKPEKMEEVI